MGLFARGPILEGTVIAFYNGIRIEKTARERKEEENIQDDDEFEFKDSHRLRLTKDFDLDIPPGDRDLSQYSATIGHKVGHVFSAIGYAVKTWSFFRSATLSSQMQ